MATAPPETFTLLPLHLDPTTKSLSSPLPTLTTQLTDLTTLHRTLLSLPATTHGTPPPPVPTAPNRSAQITKLRDSANALLHNRRHPPNTTTTTSSITTSSSSPPAQSQIHEAIKLYTYALSMALSRPAFEPAALVREEASVLFANRAQAHMLVSAWAEGWGDAQSSVECKRGPGNGKAWWRGSKCLGEMGRWGEALEWVVEGLEVEGDGAGELMALRGEIESRLREREGRR